MYTGYKLYGKNIKNTTTLTSSDIWRIFAELYNPLSLKLANKQAIEDEFNINGGKHILVYF